MPAMIRCPECSGQGCSHCGGDGWYEDVYSADDPDAPDGWYDDDDYDQDEWYDDDDQEPEEWSFDRTLYKAPNGHLCVVEVTCWKYRHQYWGETVDQWQEVYIRLGDMQDEYRQAAIQQGRAMKLGENQPFYPDKNNADDDTDEDADDNIGDIPF